MCESRCAPRCCRQTWIRLANFLLLCRDGSDGYCDGCLEVRDALGVVPIHTVLEVTPQSEVWGGSGLVSAVTTPDCGERFWNISLSGCRQKEFLLYRVETLQMLAT